MKKFIKKIMGIGVVIGLLLETFPVWALVKDETIYAKLENNGQVNKVIVSEHLQGTGEDKTFDRSKLDEIKNINGDEKYTKDGNKLVWESNGKDIYYQGQTKEELPISLKITYYFNGEESTIKDMLGKKGNVKIVFKYTNNDRHEQYINGKYSVLYTPFVVATTTILSNSTNYNIKVTNGKVIGNGTQSVIVLLSTPGLYESLGIDKLKGMDTAEITFDTDSFALSSIYSVATPKLIDKSDLEMLNNFDGIYNSINTLVDSSNKLKSGSNQLLNGATQLKDGLEKLKAGVDTAYNGSKLLTDTLSYKLSESANAPLLTDEQRSDALADAKKGVDKNFFGNSGITDINTFANIVAKQKVDAQFDLSSVEEDTIDNLRKDENIISYKANVDAMIAAYESDETFMAKLAGCQTDPNPCKIDREIVSYNLLKNAINTLEQTAGTVALNTATEAYNGVLASTEETIKETYNGLVSTAQITAVTTAEETVKKARETSAELLTPLLENLTKLTSGLNEINNGMISLDTGTSTLKDGIAALDNGIYQFNSQGISKISDLVNGDVKTIEEKLKALGKLSVNYGTFDDSEAGTEGATKIIMVVDEVSSNETKINTVDKNIVDAQSLWDKIKEEINKAKNKK